ncbi:MAG: methyltransferase domain-containing protein [Candidatus Solibacter usitatus]|nr:methyltransferase domain-containing protein [Candidatus Solibacter usitatus]
MSEATPLKFMEVVNGLQKSAVARTAIELDIFSLIARGHDTVAGVARETECAEKGIRVLLDALTVLDLIAKHDDHYRLTRDSETFLDRQSPQYMGDCVEFLHSPFMQQAFLRFTDAVRRGGTAAGSEGTVAPDHPVWVDYARAMMPLALPQAETAAAFAGAPARVLDIAAGHGMFGVKVLERCPAARCTAVDWPNVLDYARQNATRAGVESRWTGVPGSVFDADFGAGYDCVLLANILHHFTREDCAAILRRMHAAMNAGGRLLIVEMAPNDDRVTPSAAAWFATMMLATTPSGDAYTKAEYAAMLRDAGFGPPEAHPVPGSARTVLVALK